MVGMAPTGRQFCSYEALISVFLFLNTEEGRFIHDRDK